MALAWIASFLGGSSILGLGVYWLSRKITRLYLRILLSVVLGFLVLLFAAGALFLIGENPATNEPVGSQCKVAIRVKQSPRTLAPSGKLDKRDPEGGGFPAEWIASENGEVVEEVQVYYPSSVKPNEDFTLLVSASSPKGLFTPGQHSIQLSAPAAARLRTSDQCKGQNTKENLAAACAAADSSSFRASWDVTPSQPGDFIFTFTIPSALLVARQRDRDWIAQVGDCGFSYKSSIKYRGYGLVQWAELSPDKPYAQWEGRSVDLDKGQVRIPVEVVTTLGVNRDTYTVLGFVGTLLSAFLGTGWLWQLLTWLRSQSKTGRPIATS